MAFWKSLKEAIRGTEQDFTQGSISRAVFLLATPMVLEMLMESLFAIVNIFWVTRLGADSVATVGLTESLLTLVLSVAIGICMSTTAMVARRIGEKDPESAATAAGQSILLGSGLALVMGVPGWLMAPRLLAWMGATPEVVATGSHYAQIAIGTCLVVMLLFVNNAVFRGAGDASVAMRALWLSNGINLLVDPCLIFGLGPFPALGVTGAAISTLVGRTAGVVYQFHVMMSGRARVRLRWSDLRLAGRVMRSLARVSSTGVLQFLVAHASWIVLVRFISVFGSLAVAGYTIGVRIFVFVILPSWGLSGAAATMVGQNLGAKRPDRAERAVYLTALYNSIFLGAVAAAFIGAPEPIVRLFTSDGEIARYASDCLRIVGFGNLGYALGMVLVQAFNGAGDTITPTLINLVGFWLCEIPLAWVLAFPAGMQVRGVFYSIPIAETLVTLMGLAVFARGRWKEKRI
jgi:putative MATE family efflux protein